MEANATVEYFTSGRGILEDRGSHVGSYKLLAWCK